MRDALAHAGETLNRIVSAWIGTALAQDDAATAAKQWREVADQVRPRVPPLPFDLLRRQNLGQLRPGWPAHG